MVSVSDNGIEDLIAWADGIVYISLDDGVICNYVCDDFRLTEHPSNAEIIELPVNPVEYRYQDSAELAKLVSEQKPPRYFAFGNYAFDLIV